MHTDRQIIQALIDEYQGDQLAAYIANELGKVSITENMMRVLDKRQRELEAEHAKRQAELDEERAAIRAKCRHLSVSYYGDPAGGSDSFYECDHCGEQGKYVRKKERVDLCSANA